MDPDVAMQIIRDSVVELEAALKGRHKDAAIAAVETLEQAAGDLAEWLRHRGLMPRAAETETGAQA